MTIILKGIKAYEIVVDGVSPAEDAHTSEIDDYNHVYRTASGISIQAALHDIFKKIVELKTPPPDVEQAAHRLILRFGLCTTFPDNKSSLPI
jgi:hypothetical protein